MDVCERTLEKPTIKPGGISLRVASGGPAPRKCGAFAYLGYRLGGTDGALTIRHRTTYLYHQPVKLGQNRLRLRPRESSDLRLISSEVTVTPAATVSWAHDVFGNAIATANFEAMTDRLVIDSTAYLQLGGEAWPVFDIAGSAICYPFRYSDDEWADLGALAVQQYDDPDDHEKMGRGIVRNPPTRWPCSRQARRRRPDPLPEPRGRGTQAPLERSSRLGFVPRLRRSRRGSAALASGRGSSRATSTIPIATRWDRTMPGRPMPGPRSMCWARAGCLRSDQPQRRRHNLIRGRGASISAATPVTGSFVGMTDAFRGMWVE